MGSGNDGRTLTQTDGIWLSASRNLECSDMGETTITERPAGKERSSAPAGALSGPRIGSECFVRYTLAGGPREGVPTSGEWTGSWTIPERWPGHGPARGRVLQYVPRIAGAFSPTHLRAHETRHE